MGAVSMRTTVLNTKLCVAAAMRPVATIAVATKSCLFSSLSAVSSAHYRIRSDARVGLGITTADDRSRFHARFTHARDPIKRPRHPTDHTWNISRHNSVSSSVVINSTGGATAECITHSSGRAANPRARAY